MLALCALAVLSSAQNDATPDIVPQCLEDVVPILDLEYQNCARVISTFESGSSHDGILHS